MIPIVLDSSEISDGSRLPKCDNETFQITDERTLYRNIINFIAGRRHTIKF